MNKLVLSFLASLAMVSAASAATISVSHQHDIAMEYYGLSTGRGVPSFSSNFYLRELSYIPEISNIQGASVVFSFVDDADPTSRYAPSSRYVDENGVQIRIDWDEYRGQREALSYTVNWNPRVITNSPEYHYEYLTERERFYTGNTGELYVIQYDGLRLTGFGGEYVGPFSYEMSLTQSDLESFYANGWLRYAVTSEAADFIFTGASLNINYFESETVSSVPIPSAAWLLGSGLVGMVTVARRRARSAAQA